MTDETTYFLTIIAVIIGLIVTRNMHKGFERGKNIIFKSNAYIENSDCAVEPQYFESEFNYPYKFKMRSAWFLVLLGCAFILSNFIFTDLDLMNAMWLGIVIIILALNWMSEIMSKQVKYKKSILKIGYKGLYTLNLGFVSWARVKEINIYYVYKVKIKPIEVSYLEIITFNKKIDKLLLHEVGYDKQKLKGIIEKFSPEGQDVIQSF